MKRFDGIQLQEKLAQRLQAAVASLSLKPALTIVQVGDDPASTIYVERKKEFGAQIGCRVHVIHRSDTATADELADIIQTQNDDPTIHGIIVQLPLPDHLSKEILQKINPRKDVDGLGKDSPFTPATPRAILAILDDQKVEIRGKNTVVVGRSALVGSPSARLLKERGANVTVCHSKTRDLTPFTSNADILVVAVGQPNLVTVDMVKKGSAVINVGGTLGKDGQLHGDVDPAAADKASLFTPVLGGVGPVTVAMLFSNLIEAAKRHEDLLR